MTLLRASLLVGAAALLATTQVGAQQITGTYPPVPLASKGPYVYPSGIPYKVDTDVGLIRGTQKGYNICNGTTENQNSLCQTGWLNGVDDFCLWAPAEPGHMVGDIEGEMVAWCSKPGHGTRLIPDGAIKGIQFTKTPDYVQVVGFIDQTQINMLEEDWGGEMDPHGADLRGNPMGGLVFSSQYNNKQVIEWHNFMGNNVFCFKACDPAGPNAKHFCEHVFDRIGCQYNAPSSLYTTGPDLKDPNARGVFEACEGENQDYPGTWTAADGKVMTYTQPPESLGAISTTPYPVRIPKSSACVQYESASLFTGLPTVVPTAGPSASALASASSASSANVAPSASRTATGASTQQTGSATGSGAAPVQTDNAAMAVGTTVLSGALGLAGVVFSALFLA